VQFLCSFDGTDGQTTSTDDSDNSIGLTFNSDAQLDDANLKFGTTSLLLDGTGDHVDLVNNSAYKPGASDFAIHAFVAVSSLPTSGVQRAIGGVYQSASNQRAYIFAIYNTGGAEGTVLRFWWSANGADPVAVYQADWNHVETNRMYHVAASRQGDTWRLFLDGKKILQEVTSGTMISPAAIPHVVGGLDGGIVLWAGWIDENEIVVGEALFTKDFIPPQSKLPRQ
jgi:hypothetical protein